MALPMSESISSSSSAATASSPPVTVRFENLPPAPRRPVQWRRLREQLDILGESDPAKVLDAAYSTGDALGGGSEERLVRRFLASADGQRLLAKRPCLTEALADHAGLAGMPLGSLGRAFLAFSEHHRLDPRALIASHHAMSRDHARLDPVRRWIRDRMTAMHDVWHVIAGYDATPAGETALMCFSLPQRLNDRAIPIFATMSITLRRITPSDAWRAFQRGRRAKFLFATPFEELLPLPLDTVRSRLGVSSPARDHPEPQSVELLIPLDEPSLSARA